MSASVKLIVDTGKDLAVLSALLQDATVLIGDMGHDPDSMQFLMVAARFISDGDKDGDGHPRRRLMGVNFSGITKVIRRGFHPAAREDVLALLAIRRIPAGLELVFSGEATIRLATSAIKVYAADLNEGWQTAFTPAHDTGQAIQHKAGRSRARQRKAGRSRARQG